MLSGLVVLVVVAAAVAIGWGYLRAARRQAGEETRQRGRLADVDGYLGALRSGDLLTIHEEPETWRVAVEWGEDGWVLTCVVPSKSDAARRVAAVASEAGLFERMSGDVPTGHRVMEYGMPTGLESRSFAVHRILFDGLGRRAEGTALFIVDRAGG